MTILNRIKVCGTEPLLACLIDKMELKRKDIKNLLKAGAVTVNGLPVTQFDHLLSAADEVVVSDLRTAVAAGDLKRARIHVVYEDDCLIVLDKPAGMLTVATASEKTDTLFRRLGHYLRGHSSAGPGRAFVVHRLDQETSGLVLFAKSEAIRDRLQDDWGAIEKLYQAAVIGEPDPSHGLIATYLTETTALQVFSNDHQTHGSRLAKTHYRVLRTSGDLSLLELRLETGRKHQIRVHLAEIGCPVVGDTRYNAKDRSGERLALHATSLELVHPQSGKPLRFDSPLPAAIRKLVPRSTD
jgi:23S rRNA pseudouridine1911/1915/1917 synthase